MFILYHDNVDDTVLVFHFQSIQSRQEPFLKFI